MYYNIIGIATNYTEIYHIIIILCRYTPIQPIIYYIIGIVQSLKGFETEIYVDDHDDDDDVDTISKITNLYKKVYNTL